MKRTLLAPCLASLLLAGCAGDAPRAPTASSAGERQQFCRNQMYGERTARGRSAPNWNLYEQCMRQPAAG
jgi:outer membrane biogenesis lipoprotein LolB